MSAASWKPLTARPGVLARFGVALASPAGLSPYTYRSRRGALQAISFLRETPDRLDLSDNVKRIHVAYWLDQLRYHRRLHTQMVWMWRAERQAAE